MENKGWEDREEKVTMKSCKEKDDVNDYIPEGTEGKVENEEENVVDEDMEESEAFLEEMEEMDMNENTKTEEEYEK